MAETPKQSPWRTLSEEETGFLQQNEEQGQRRGTERKTERPDGSFLLDMEGLFLVVDSGNTAAVTTETGSIANPRVPKEMHLQKTLSRKGSQSGDRKAGSADDGTLLPATAAGSGTSRAGAAAHTPAAAPPDKFVAVVVAPAAVAEATATTPRAVSPSPGRAAPSRRVHGRRAAVSSTWLHPRRVLLFFATLSSVGTIILLYFTLSMEKMSQGDANAR